MPGLVGRISSSPGAAAEVARARDSIKHHLWYRDDEVFSEGTIHGTRTHLGRAGAQSAPVEGRGLRCWFEGEFLNAYRIAASLDMADAHPPGLLIEARHRGRLDEVCAGIEGRYVAVIFDPGDRRLVLISDRHGLKPLYVWQEPGRFAWASELKAFLSMSDFQPRVRPDAIAAFLDHHMLGDVTWFEGVTQLPASTLLEVHVDTLETEIRRYWSWGEIRPRDMTFHEASEALGGALRRSVAQAVESGGAYHLPLSGGLDSRAILAAVEDPSVIDRAVTFGARGSVEIGLAARAARIRGVPHEVSVLTSRDWLRGRAAGVWQSDGLLNLLHLHAPPRRVVGPPPEAASLNGFLADVTLGGGALLPARMNRRVDAGLAGQAYGVHARLAPWDDPYYDGDHFDPYLLDNRSRRFINAALRLREAELPVRTPLFTNEILELIYSLPDEFRLHNRLYGHCLLSNFPGLFRGIPWAKTGRTLLAHQSDNGPLRPALMTALRRRLPGMNPASIADYPGWLRQPRTALLLRRMFHPRTALYPHFVPRDFWRELVGPHLARVRDHSDAIGRALTLEIWLQQVFNKRYRDEDLF